MQPSSLIHFRDSVSALHALQRQCLWSVFDKTDNCFPFSLCIFQALTEVATMVARTLYLQAGGAEIQLDNINADPQTVCFSDLFCELKCLSLPDAAFVFDNWSVNQHWLYCKFILFILSILIFFTSLVTDLNCLFLFLGDSNALWFPCSIK